METSGYSLKVAAIYVFNLIFGSGALLLPYAFYNVGWLPASIMLFSLALFSFITCTYVVESMSLACAVEKFTKIDQNGRLENDDFATEEATANEHTSILTHSDETRNDQFFDISKKFELSDMAKMFFGRKMLYLFFGVTILYLYGDLCIYLSVIGMSLTDFTCVSMGNKSQIINEACEKFGKANFFRIYITIFTFSLGILAFFNVQKTKFVQIGTILLRWTAFILMLSLAISQIHEKRKFSRIPTFKSSGLAPFFGTVLYAFMCQHSIPSIIAPVKERSKSYTPIFIFSLVLSLTLYFLLTITAGLSFGDEILPVYSLNFANLKEGIWFTVLGCFLQLFPVVALSSSYPVVCVTLRENIKALMLLPYLKESVSDRDFPPVSEGEKSEVKTLLSQMFNVERLDTGWIVGRIIIPLCVVLPPYLLLLVYHKHVQTISSLTGSYAGNALQYLVPTLLIVYAKRRADSYQNFNNRAKNQHESPFYNKFWLTLIFLWSFISFFAVTYSNIMNVMRSLSIAVPSNGSMEVNH